MCVSFRLSQNKIIHALDDKAMLFMKPDRAIFTKNGGGYGFVQITANFPLTAAMLL